MGACLSFGEGEGLRRLWTVGVRCGHVEGPRLSSETKANMPRMKKGLTTPRTPLDGGLQAVMKRCSACSAHAYLVKKSLLEMRSLVEVLSRSGCEGDERLKKNLSGFAGVACLFVQRSHA